MRPAIFGDEPFDAGLARASAEQRWLLVEVTDATNPACWATAYTTWRDADLVAWVEANAVAIQIDACADVEMARIVGVDPSLAPTVILFRDAKERLRVTGPLAAPDLLSRFEWADLAESNIAIARKMMKDPERDMLGREGLAKALLNAGLFGEALEHFDWLWCHSAEADPEFAGVRVSFMAGEIGLLCEQLPAAHVRFAELRELAAGAASVADLAGLRACRDFVVLNDELGDDDRTLGWLDGLDSEQRRALPRGLVDLFLVPLLYEHARWADVGALIGDPLHDLEELAERAQQRRDLEKHLAKTSRPKPTTDAKVTRYFKRFKRRHDTRTIRRIRRGLYESVAALYRSLIAAGRDRDAAEVRNRALQIEDSPAMRAALA